MFLPSIKQKNNYSLIALENNLNQFLWKCWSFYESKRSIDITRVFFSNRRVLVLHRHFYLNQGFPLTLLIIPGILQALLFPAKLWLKWRQFVEWGHSLWTRQLPQAEVFAKTYIKIALTAADKSYFSADKVYIIIRLMNWILNSFLI